MSVILFIKKDKTSILLANAEGYFPELPKNSESSSRTFCNEFESLTQFKPLEIQ